MPPLRLEGSGAPLLEEEEPVQTGKYRKQRSVLSLGCLSVFVLIAVLTLTPTIVCVDIPQLSEPGRCNFFNGTFYLPWV